MISTRYDSNVDAALACDLLERIGALVRSERRRLAASHDLLPVHVDVLAYLARANRYSDTPAALTEWLGSTKGTVSQTIVVLERKKLVARRGDAADRRRVHLELTAAGRRALESLDPPPLLAGAFEEIPGCGQLATQLQDLLRKIQRSAGLRTFGLCRTCRFFTKAGDGFQCGLTEELLSEDDAKRRCREHQPA